MGKRIKLRSNWDDIKLDVMEFALQYKFAPGTTWADKLIATGDEQIIEWNNWGDTFWGRTHDGHGDNHLGLILMKIRSQLIS